MAENLRSMASRTPPLRILVHSEMVGAIIGRSGNTIKAIIQQTKAKIDVHKDESRDQHEKVITITGQPESCSEACFRIVEIVRNEKIAKYEGAEHQSRDITLKILAPGALIGRIIGRSGASIKKLMEQTSTRINISTNNITESTGEHTIIVQGDLDNVLQAERMISSKLRSAYMSNMNNLLPFMSQQHFLFNNVALPYMQNPYAHNPILSSLVSSQTSVAGGNAMQRNLSSNSHQSQQIYPSTPGYYNAGYLGVTPASALLGFNPMLTSSEHERETVFIYIPSVTVGAMIGKSGAAIKEMISTSGAAIKVAAAPPPESNHSALNELKQSSAKSRDTNSSNCLETDNQDFKETVKNNDAEESQIFDNSSPKAGGSRQSFGTFNAQYETRKVTIIGSPTSQYYAQNMIYRKIASEIGKSDIDLMVEINVPLQAVGKIIGKGGGTVKQIQKQTRTLIRLPEDKSSQSRSEADSVTTLQITGVFEGSQAAQRQIRYLIRESINSRQNRPQIGRNAGSSSTKNNANHSEHHESASNEPSNSHDIKYEEVKSNSGGEKVPSHTESTSYNCYDDCSYQQEQGELNSQKCSHDPSSDNHKESFNSISCNNNTISNHVHHVKSTTNEQSHRENQDLADELKKTSTGDCSGDQSGQW